MLKWLNIDLSINWLKALISIVAIGAIVIRIIYPDVRIDAITFGLIILAVLPWLSELIESAKFPGGWEVKFRDLRAAGTKVTGASEESTSEENELKPSFISVAEHDPNLALVGLRIEIEKRIREYADIHGLDNRRPLTHMMRELMKREALPEETIGGLKELIYAGNAAAHGARVPEGVADWAIEEGPRILSALDKKLK